MHGQKIGWEATRAGNEDNDFCHFLLDPKSHGQIWSEAEKNGRRMKVPKNRARHSCAQSVLNMKKAWLDGVAVGTPSSRLQTMLKTALFFTLAAADHKYPHLCPY